MNKPIAAILFIALLAGVAYTLKSPEKEITRTTTTPETSHQATEQVINGLTSEQREQSARQTLQQTANDPNWPATPQQLIREFWLALSQKNLQRATQLAPGSTAKDFTPYFLNGNPSPAKSIGPAEPHPQQPDIQLYPVKIDFPFMKNKTIKLAVVQGPDNRLFIHGQYSIWW